MGIDLTVYSVDYKNVDGKQHIKLEEINTYHDNVADLFLDKVGNLAEIENGCFKEVDLVDLLKAQRDIKDDITLYEKHVSEIDLKKVNEVIEKKEKEFAELTRDKGFINLAKDSIVSSFAIQKVNNNEMISDEDKQVYSVKVSVKLQHNMYTQGLANSYALLQMIDEIIKGMGLDEEDIKNYNELDKAELEDARGESTCMVAVWF